VVLKVACCNPVWHTNKKLVETLGWLATLMVVGSKSGGRWVVQITVKGQKNRTDALLRTDFGLRAGWCQTQASTG
jgi:hypothetical protein